MNRLTAIAPLFRYPDGDFARSVSAARAAAPAVEPFIAAADAMPFTALQGLYSATFELAPACSPYLGSHVFGDESPARARFLLGLREKGLGAAELPDHVAEVLAHAEAFDDAEWGELRDLVLVPALTKMNALLAETNPYRLLVRQTLLSVGSAATAQTQTAHGIVPPRADKSVCPTSGGSS